MVTPENHYGLEAKQKLLETLQQEVPVYEAKFAPLHEQFTLLEKYEKPVPDSVSWLSFDVEEMMLLSIRHETCSRNWKNVGNITCSVSPTARKC